MAHLPNRLTYHSGQTRPLLPHNHHFVNKTCEEAYMKCAEYEQHVAGADSRLDNPTSGVFARMLGYLISEAFCDRSQMYIAKQILAYSKIDGGLYKLANIYAMHIVKRFMLKEDVASSQSYKDMAEDIADEEDPDTGTLGLMERIESQKFKCAVTKATDIDQLNSERASNESMHESDSGCHLRCVHLIPRFDDSDTSLILDQNPPEGQSPLTLYKIWFTYFCICIEDMVPSEYSGLYNSPANTLAVSSEVAAHINSLTVWLDRDTNPETNNMDSTFDAALDLAYLTSEEVDKYPQRVIFDEMPMPSLLHLRLCASMARVAIWSGLKNYLLGLEGDVSEKE
ncbi:hypothetical protein CVT24_013239 [Panaeolus cyanescens]|uniref:Uncharacterized protein n=1 Tax=Panaeolus cyanescens TaxID=181874 RepID=A0A409WAN0_9AGAR|nr:hypothetical protein CVT24_013239 [Panaeolus cyanescens]